MFLNVLLDKFKEVVYSILPITIIVLILNFTFVPLGFPMLIRFLAGAFMIIVGLTIFLMGIDLGITPVGKLMGSSLAKSNKIIIIAFAGLLLGFIVSIAEPDLQILAGQVDAVTAGVISKWLLVVVVSTGIGLLLATGLLRILFNIPLYKTLTVLYIIIFILALFSSSPIYLGIAFDASGATTGALTVPFVMALALGISAMKKDSKASEKDSFGLVGIVSAGAIMAVLFMSTIIKTGDLTGSLEKSIYQTDTGSVFRQAADAGAGISDRTVPSARDVHHISESVFQAEEETAWGYIEGLYIFLYWPDTFPDRCKCGLHGCWNTGRL
jgi:hypothetical protein